MQLPFDGLTTEEVAERIARGQNNVNPDAKKGKSIKEIILSNTITFFNIINVIFFILVISARSFKNCAFLLVIIVNTAIGIFQEIRTKRQLDKLRILTTSHANVVRDKKLQKIPVEELVLDDIILLKNGDQISSDAIVIKGNIEVNESLLTGEADNIYKTKDATVYSGSFVTSGQAFCRITHVGKDNYVETISGEARKFKKVNSELQKYLNRILKAVSYIIIPLCTLLFLKSYFLNNLGWEASIVSMVTSGIGMIPEGLILLTSVSLTIGVLQLAKKRTVVQELFSIESLARVDVLCLDKTGTLTEGKMKVEEVVAVDQERLKEITQQLALTDTSKNATQEALEAKFGAPPSPWTATFQIPFSSDRKYSGCSYENKGTFYMGAVNFLFPGNTALYERAQLYAEDGFRVLAIASSCLQRKDYTLPEDLTFVGFVVLSDVIRKDCEKTLQYFKEQGVALKCISGDDPVTVSKIAQKCGLEGAQFYVDATSITTKEQMMEALNKYTVFGRVKPEQKKFMVECLQEQGHTVAMTGDGVNDVLALRQADCSIAMAQGADAAKNASKIVLLDSNFSSMPDVLKEGRRVINNICHSSSMYLIKTTFSILITLGTLIFGKNYPFDAIQFSVISGCAVGIPTFFLQMEPSYSKIKTDFMIRVFRNAVPAGIYIAITCLLFINIGNLFDPFNTPMLRTICIFCIGWIYFYMLRRIFSPLTMYRRIIIYTMEIVCIGVEMLGQDFLSFTDVSATGVLLIILVISLAQPTIQLLERVYDKHIGHLILRINKYGDFKINKKFEKKIQKIENKRKDNG